VNEIHNKISMRLASHPDRCGDCSVELMKIERWRSLGAETMRLHPWHQLRSRQTAGNSSRAGQQRAGESAHTESRKMHGELKTESVMNIEGSQGLYKVGSPAGRR
jgi:hypothetical protein